MATQAFDEVEAGLVASGEDVGDAGACDMDRVGELRLRNIFSR